MPVYRSVFKKVFVPTLFVIIMCVSLWPQSLDQNGDTNYISNLDETTLPMNQNGALVNDPFTSAGSNQTAQVFLQNASSAQGINTFNISSTYQQEYLDYGQYNLTLPKNYNTTHTKEDDTPFETMKYDNIDGSGQYVSIGSEYYAPLLSKNVDDLEGTIKSGSNSSLDSIDGSIINITSTTASPHTAKFDLNAKFNNIPDSNGILGFLVNLYMQTNTSVKLDISKYNQISSTSTPDQSITYNSALTYGTVYTYKIINTNLNYFDSTNKVANLTFTFSNVTVDFQVNVDRITIAALKVKEQNITSTNMVALEFETLGDATVYGFQAWVRSNNIAAVGETSNLTVQLYHSNITTPVARSTLLSSTLPLISPDLSDLLAENTYLNFSGDGLVWFNFTNDFTGIDLNISNYFVVLRSNTTTTPGAKGLSLVTVPSGTSPNTVGKDPDTRIDHLLLQNSTINWAQVIVGVSVHCDAANFSLNLTRAWKPSELVLHVENDLVQDTFISSYPHDETNVKSYLNVKWWGLGTISHFYSSHIPAINGNLTVQFTCNNTAMTNLNFSAIYSVRKYVIWNTTSVVSLIPDTLPQWNITFDYQPSNYINWKFLEINYSIPQEWDTNALYAPNGTNCIGLALNRSNVLGRDIVQVKVNSTVIASGNYTLIAKSPNYVKTCGLNLQYKDNYWQSNGFMQGDNITTFMYVMNQKNEAVENDGLAIVKLFNSSGSFISPYMLQDSQIDLNYSSSGVALGSLFNFDKALIYKTNNTVAKGTYYVVAYWYDGENAGIYKREFSINGYDAFQPKIEYDRKNNLVDMYGTISTFDTDLDAYNLNLFAVKKLETIDLAQYVNNFMYNNSFEYDISAGASIVITQVAINETVINAGENITVVFDVENRNPDLSFDLKFSVGITSLMNNNWIITNTSTNLVNLVKLGDEDSKHRFTVELTIPTIEQGGINCPLRMGPMSLEIALVIDNRVRNWYQSTQHLYYMNASDSVFEGKVLAVYEIYNALGGGYDVSFNRTLLNIPGETYYFIQPYNEYYQTMTSIVNQTNTQLLDGKVNDFKAIQSNLNHTSIVNLTGTVVDENGKAIGTQQMNFKYFNSADKSWSNVILANAATSFTTNSEGYFNVQVNLNQTPIASSVILQLIYAGKTNEIMSFAQNITILLNQFVNTLDVSLNYNKLMLDYKNLFTLTITNTGNSTFTKLSVSLVNSSFSSKIYLGLLSKSQSLKPGEIYICQIELYESILYSKDKANFTIQVTADTIETEQAIVKSTDYSINVYRASEMNMINSAILIVFFGSVLFVWVYGVLYMRRKYQDLNNLPTSSTLKDEAVKPSRKAGKYVNVSELSKKPKESENQGTKLDDLIKKEGLNNENK